MKATFEIPDDLYRRVKARSAMEGRPLRSVTVELLQNWLASSVHPPDGPQHDALTEAEIRQYPWLKITRPHIRPGMSHDLAEIEQAIVRGWGAELTEKLRRTENES